MLSDIGRNHRSHVEDATVHAAPITNWTGAKRASRGSSSLQIVMRGEKEDAAAA